MRARIPLLLAVLISIGALCLGLSSFELVNAEDEIPRKGTVAPDFTLRDTKGALHRLSQYRGKVVLLVMGFYGEYCGPCNIQMPSIQILHDRFSGKGLIVLGVGTLGNESLEKILEFAEENNITFPLLPDHERTVAKSYKVKTMPHTFVIDVSGRVVTRIFGARDWEAPEAIEYISATLKP